MRNNKQKNKLLKTPEWFNLEDYNICQEYINSLPFWAINIHIRKNIYTVIDTLIDHASNNFPQEIANSMIQKTIDDFLVLRKALLTHSGIKNEMKNKNLYRDVLTFTTWRHPPKSIRKLDLFDITILHNKLTAKTTSEQKDYSKYAGSEYIVLDLSINKEQILKEISAYIDNIRPQKITQEKQKYMRNIPEDFNNIRGETIGFKLNKYCVLQYLDLSLIEKYTQTVEYTEEKMAEILDLNIDTISRDTKRLAKKLMRDDDYYYSLMRQAQCIL